MPAAYRSPLTGAVWLDARAVVGTVLALTLAVYKQRPRRHPPAGQDAAVDLAIEAAATFASLPALRRNDPEIGAVISSTYWQAKQARGVLQRLVDEPFQRNADYWSQWRAWLRDHAHDSPWVAAQYETPVDGPVRVARLAWWLAFLVERAASGGMETLDVLNAHHDVLLGVLWELDELGVPRDRAKALEEQWLFVAAAGRLPTSPADRELLAAFEAMLLADAPDLAVALVKKNS